jgi:hypothetical protein
VATAATKVKMMMLHHECWRMSSSFQGHTFSEDAVLIASARMVVAIEAKTMMTTRRAFRHPLTLAPMMGRLPHCFLQDA